MSEFVVPAIAGQQAVDVWEGQTKDGCAVMCWRITPIVAWEVISYESGPTCAFPVIHEQRGVLGVINADGTVTGEGSHDGDYSSVREFVSNRANGMEIHPSLVAAPMSIVEMQGGAVSTYKEAFGMWLMAHFLTTPATAWQPISQVKQAALSANVVSERWWNEHSGSYLEKRNVGGVWYCSPKEV